MAQASLGLIETIGLVAAVEAADVAVKSASVVLVGYELAEGGLAVVKIQGDVGAVRAAVTAAGVAAARVGRVVACHVIARPADGLSGLINNARTVGRSIQSEPQEPPEPAAPLVIEPAPMAAGTADAVCEDKEVTVAPIPASALDPEPRADMQPSLVDEAVVESESATSAQVAAKAAEPEPSAPGLLGAESPEPQLVEPAAVADEVPAIVEPGASTRRQRRRPRFLLPEEGAAAPARSLDTDRPRKETR